jgi:hypothetical protein
MDETTETDVIEKIEEEVVQEKIDLKTLEKEMDEVRQRETVVPKLENIVEHHKGGNTETIDEQEQSNNNSEVKDLIESMKQDNIQNHTISSPNNQEDSSVNDGSDSDTDSIVFDNDDEISLSGFDIEEI